MPLAASERSQRLWAAKAGLARLDYLLLLEAVEWQFIYWLEMYKEEGRTRNNTAKFAGALPRS